MLLVITPSAKARGCAQAIQQLVPNLPSAAEIKMRAVRDLAQEVRGKLEESLQAIERFRSGCLRLGDSPRHVLHVQPFAHAEVFPKALFLFLAAPSRTTITQQI